jgi:hypothetical protein
VQINRYDRGDYVLPHRDDCQQTIFMLTSSERDGLVVEAAAGLFVRVLDSAGQSVTHPPEAWHWVEPVLDTVRYTLVTIWDDGRRA